MGAGRGVSPSLETQNRHLCPVSRFWKLLVGKPVRVPGNPGKVSLGSSVLLGAWGHGPDEPVCTRQGGPWTEKPQGCPRHRE